MDLGHLGPKMDLAPKMDLNPKMVLDPKWTLTFMSLRKVFPNFSVHITYFLITKRKPQGHSSQM